MNKPGSCYGNWSPSAPECSTCFVRSGCKESIGSGGDRSEKPIDYLIRVLKNKLRLSEVRKEGNEKGFFFSLNGSPAITVIVKDGVHVRVASKKGRKEMPEGISSFAEAQEIIHEFCPEID